MFSKLKERVNSAVDKAGKAITQKEITEENLDEVLEGLKISLLQSDVALATAEEICDQIKLELKGEEVKRRKVEEIIKETFRNSVREILSQEELDFVDEVKQSEKPVLVLFLGFNGSGKTTTLGKFAKLFLNEDLNTLLAAADTYRAASIEQLEKHAERLGIEIIKHEYGADAAAVVYDAMEHAESEEIDVVLADTAGRSHADANLMGELKKICRVNDPHWKILVLDSLVGNDAVNQAEKFEEAVEVDGIVLSKMDVNEKGGAALSVANSISKPILYIGVGQEYEDLESFDPGEISQRILG